LSRRLNYHTQFLREVAKSSPQTDVAWDINVVRQSLQFFADQETAAGKGAARAAGAIFEKTGDDEIRRLSLDALSKMNNKTARKELLRLFQLQPPQTESRTDIATRLRRALESNAQVKAKEAKLLLSQLEQ
jgi:hypothetical protein